MHSIESVMGADTAQFPIAFRHILTDVTGKVLQPSWVMAVKMDPCGRVPNRNNLYIPAVLRKRYFLVRA